MPPSGCPMGDRPSAVQFFQAAVNAVNAKDNPEHLVLAYQLFASSVNADPNWWESNYQSGNNNSDLNHYPSALASWRRALECDMEPMERSKVLTNLSWRCQCVGLIEEAKDYAEQALEIDPAQAYAYVNLALVFGTLDRPDIALDNARKAHSLKPDDTVCQMCLAFQLLFDHKFAEGLKHFEARFAYKLKNYLNYPYPKWVGEENKTVFIVADQGLGDTLCFARFIPQAAARSKYVYAYIQGELMRTFQHAFSHLANVNFLPANTPFPPADYWTTFMSLPFALKSTDKEIRETPNYKMFAGRDFPQNWKLPDRKLHIGCAWGGSPMNDIDKNRSFPVTQLCDLYRVPGIQLYSLQVGPRAGDMHDNGMAPIMRDLTPYIREVSNTVALIQDLDLIISCESACAHIASLAGKETWIPYSYLGRDWRIGHTGEDRLWTPQHRIFRQGPDQKWEPVFAKIVEALHERVAQCETKKQAA